MIRASSADEWPSALNSKTLGIMSDTSMSPIHLALGKSVLAVELFDQVRSERIATFHRKGKHCTFSAAIPHGDFELTLRLDWGETQEGEPTLDLDVVRITPDGARKKLKPKQIPQHHSTLSSFLPSSDAPRSYDLEYQGLSMRLVAKKTFGLAVSLSAFVVNPDEETMSK